MYLIAAEFSWTSPDSWLAILMVAVGLGFVILVHELGHFLVAKACGVKCEKFYIGFDFFDIKLGPITIPRALVKFQWGETEYGIGIIPLGGYVKMLGQDDNPANAAREAERIRVARQQAAGEAPPTGHTLPHGDLPPEPTQEQLEQYELDPRSYPAKSVPQRMAIISAGVVMNLIFAVIFAAIAYRAGVSFVPTIVGSVIPGTPAWMAGLEPGDRILQVGRDGQPSDRLRWRWDLVNSIGLSNDREDLALLVRRAETGQKEWIELRPSSEIYEKVKLPAIGASAALSNKLDPKYPVLENSAAAKASPPLAGGDVIVAVDGEPVKDGQQLRAIMASKPAETLVFTVKRATADGKSEQLEVSVPPNPMRYVGLVMEMGKVAAVKPNSPASEAGFQSGDQIRRVQGGPVGDPMTLPYRLQQMAGQPVEFEVVRNQDGQEQLLTLTAVPQVPESTPPHMLNRAMGLEPLGLTYYVTDRVADVVPGSPAAEAGIEAGDELSDVKFLQPKGSQREQQQQLLQMPEDEIEVGRNNNRSWPYIHDVMQVMPPGTRLRINYLRNAKVQPAAELIPETRPDVFVADRGIVLLQVSEIYTATSWGEALALGLRQTKEDALKVLTVLKKLVTREIPLTMLGGPGSIAYVATSEASEGLARLLMFLTFLSANLAVLNFLPIPVLDGGHMMFLIAEGIRGKPLDEKWLVRLTVAGFAFVISLMLFVIGLDVVRFTGLYGS